MNILVTIPNGATKDTFMPTEVKKAINMLGNVTWNETNENYTEQELQEKLEDIDICFTGWGTIRFTDDVLKNANKLKIIAHTAGTVAPIISEELYAKGVKVLSGNKVFAESVAESVVAYILASLRDIPHYSNVMRQGGWKTPDYYNQGLLDQTIGLVGFGEIPKYLVGMLKPFHVKIMAFDKYVSKEKMAEFGVEKVELEDVFAQCQIISVHLPKTEDTYHMIDERLIKLIPNGALLVNTARGSVIDEKFLTKELATNRFRAVLDVFEQEPLLQDNPLRSMKNAILIPHMGGPTTDRRKYATLALLDDIKRYYEGKPLTHEISFAHANLMTR